MIEPESIIILYKLIWYEISKNYSFWKDFFFHITNICVYKIARTLIFL